MKPVVVVGSGPSGVHFALTLLRRGYRVVMVDVGYARPPALRPDDTLAQLKTNLEDPVEYLLGRDFEGITFPGAAGEYYGVPPGKEYVFREPPGFAVRTDGFAPLFSFAQGGLAEAWTGGSYPFNDAELADFPFGWNDIRPGYEEVAQRIGICGEPDDLARFMPVHDHLMPPLELDLHSQRLLERYGDVKDRLQREQGCWVGRSRIATLTQARDGRGPCRYLGRCLWGCPADALWVPSHTLAECRRHPEFEYVGGIRVTHFSLDGRRRITRLHGTTEAGAPIDVPVDTLVLAAGALGSAHIFLESVYRATGEILRLPGLMDNQQVLVPFLNLDMIGVPYRPASYQYHLLGMGLEAADPRAYVHGQITTLKTTMAHPIVQNLPFGLGTARAVFRRLRSALGLVNVNFHDTRRDDCAVTLERTANHDGTSLRIEYRPAPGEAERVDHAVRRVRRALARLHCFAPPPMIHVRPKGASVHYAGMIPMTVSGSDRTATPDGRSRDFDNLVFADGITFPFLPAKNITFTLMANAVRVAQQAF